MADWFMVLVGCFRNFMVIIGREFWVIGWGICWEQIIGSGTGSGWLRRIIMVWFMGGRMNAE